MDGKQVHKLKHDKYFNYKSQCVTVRETKRRANHQSKQIET